MFKHTEEIKVLLKILNVLFEAVCVFKYYWICSSVCFLWTAISIGQQLPRMREHHNEQINKKITPFRDAFQLRTYLKLDLTPSSAG